MERNLRMVIVADTNNAESRDLISQLSQTPAIPQTVVTPQLVRNILPGIRATPAIGVLFWATDLQGIVADVEAFASYIKGEDAVLSALETLGVKTEEEKSNEN